MNLIEFDASHISVMMQWFPDHKSTAIWGGPNFRYPYSKQSFMHDLNLDHAASFVLMSDQGTVLAFGQYYQRNKHCHLSRLVVSPLERGNGLGKQLINLLSLKGSKALQLKSCSLFVMAYNTAAIKLYLSLGFRQAVYPDNTADDIVYMLR